MADTKSSYGLLYIEDDIEVRKNYVAYLSRYFYNIDEASSAEEALLIYQNKKPSILIIDIDLPNKSGLKFLEELRQSDLTTKAIMLTAKSDVQTLLNATELKLTKYLVKPVSRGELKDALELAIQEIKNYNVVTNRYINMKGCWTWDIENQVLRKGKVIQGLTKKEGELLALLFSNTRKTFSNDDIIFELWYDADTPKESALKTLVKGLRKKLPEGTIKNIFGVGYTLDL